MNRIEEWERRGHYRFVRGRRVFYWESGAGRPLLALHGFPASSYDWRRVAEHIPGRRVIALDLPGFGLSQKSADGDYSLLKQADVVEGLLDELDVDECDIVAHDMGNSVAAELLARSNEHELGFRIGRVVLLNGSIFIKLAQLTSGQKLFLRLPRRPLPVAPPVRVFRRQIRNLFSSRFRPSDDELRMMEMLLKHDGGARLVPLTIRYIEERHQREDRWIGGIVDFPNELAVVWGERDPVAVPAMVDRLVELRPHTTCVRWADVGHWPQLEVPERVAAQLETLLT